MRRLCFALFTGILFLTACKKSHEPGDADLRKAINLYLQTHDKPCTWIGQPFPVDLSDSQQKANFGIAAKMAVLQQAGLVESTAATTTITTVPGIFGGNTQRQVKRYQPTTAGKQYLQTTQAALGQSAGFCYGTKEVDSILNWSEPTPSKPDPQTKVTYTYKISNLAPWTQRSDVQNQFNDIRTTTTGISKTHQVAGLELTNNGWEVPAY
ncbi:hypothetical protein [Edaphobacter flagellatus]|uniref:hypothetical protein n=1 Tax=Edaphobacter flagellatus TaxID=1933044 RepID=UPI0021B48BD7|nr:hypothetical protein [Edaphobacter flagellatus]